VIRQPATKVPLAPASIQSGLWKQRCIRLDTSGGQPDGKEPDMAATLEAVPSTKTVDNQTETTEADAAREPERMAKERSCP
jgi:hypothetical protein